MLLPRPPGSCSWGSLLFISFFRVLFLSLTFFTLSAGRIPGPACDKSAGLARTPSFDAREARVRAHGTVIRDMSSSKLHAPPNLNYTTTTGGGVASGGNFSRPKPRPREEENLCHDWSHNIGSGSGSGGDDDEEDDGAGDQRSCCWRREQSDARG